MKLADYLHRGDIIPGLTAADRDGALAELAGCIARNHRVDRDALFSAVLERERLGSTGIGDGIAIPHCKLRGAETFFLGFGRSEAGIDFHALDGRPVHLMFLLLAPEDTVGAHLKMLARISRILKSPATRRSLLEAADAAAIYHIILEQDERH